jgi:hypothetical protein
MITWQYALWGGIGGLVSIIVKQGYLELPRICDNKLYLGAIGGIFLGCVAGLIGDANPINAFMWGAGGGGILQGFVSVAERSVICKKEKPNNGN